MIINLISYPHSDILTFGYKVKTHSLNVCSYAVLCPFRSNREVSLGVYIDIIGCSLEPNGGMH